MCQPCFLISLIDNNNRGPKAFVHLTFMNCFVFKMGETAMLIKNNCLDRCIRAIETSFHSLADAYCVHINNERFEKTR